MTEQHHFARAAVAAPQTAATEAGRAILAQGGNAIEAMVAMAATIAVTYPHMNGIGGDGFWLIREPSGKVHAIEACGPAGSQATLKHYHEKGYDKVPESHGGPTPTTSGGASKVRPCRSRRTPVALRTRGLCTRSGHCTLCRVLPLPPPLRPWYRTRSA